MNDPITLTGYLGKDPEIRDTRERTLTLRERPATLIFEHNGAQVTDRTYDLCEEPAEYDVTPPTREYAVFSLAVHRWEGGRRKTSWHRVIVWNVDRIEHMGVRIARKGSKVEVTGRPTSYTFRDEKAEKEVTLEQIEATTVRLLQIR